METFKSQLLPRSVYDTHFYLVFIESVNSILSSRHECSSDLSRRLGCFLLPSPATKSNTVCLPWHQTTTEKNTMSPSVSPSLLFSYFLSLSLSLSFLSSLSLCLSSLYLSLLASSAPVLRTTTSYSWALIGPPQSTAQSPQGCALLGDATFKDLRRALKRPHAEFWSFLRRFIQATVPSCLGTPLSVFFCCCSYCICLLDRNCYFWCTWLNAGFARSLCSSSGVNGFLWGVVTESNAAVVELSAWRRKSHLGLR